MKANRDLYNLYIVALLLCAYGIYATYSNIF